MSKNLTRPLSKLEKARLKIDGLKAKIRELEIELEELRRKWRGEILRNQDLAAENKRLQAEVAKRDALLREWRDLYALDWEVR